MSNKNDILNLMLDGRISREDGIRKMQQPSDPPSWIDEARKYAEEALRSDHPDVVPQTDDWQDGMWRYMVDYFDPSEVPNLPFSDLSQMLPLGAVTPQQQRLYDDLDFGSRSEVLDQWYNDQNFNRALDSILSGRGQLMF